MSTHRTLGDVASSLRVAANTARGSITATIRITLPHADEVASELAQAVVLLESAAARLDLMSGVLVGERKRAPAEPPPTEKE